METGSKGRDTTVALLRVSHRKGTKYPSPHFSQVLILKRLKVVCFNTHLQVLILKGVSDKDGVLLLIRKSHGSAQTNRSGIHDQINLAARGVLGTGALSYKSNI